MKKYILSVACAVFATFGLQSCLDFDIPGDEFTGNDKIKDDVVYHGQADLIDYHKEISEEGFAKAETALSRTFGQLLTAQYSMRGGKEGNMPGGHAYQYQFSLGVDNYAGYLCLPHNFDGRIASTYYVNRDFNSGPNGSFTITKNNLTPMLNHPDIDSIPEIKAIALLLYDYASQEMADIYGPFPYINYKENKEEHPFTYNTLSEIYATIVDNIDTISACFKHYPQRPEWYKKKVDKLLMSYDAITTDWKIDTWDRFANSLKLRMAIRTVKVNPERSRKWAEEAIEAGVVEKLSQEIALDPMFVGFSNPLLEISQTWGDTRLNASFESLLMSLKHPYTTYLFEKNSNPLVNRDDNNKILAANTRVVGLRAGVRMIPGQSYDNNPRIAYSRIGSSYIAMAPLYFMKLSEVDFLRAEGAIRGWNMGESAQVLYERGIDNADVENRALGSRYATKLPEYKSLDTPVAYVYEDPMDDANNMVSVTKIGVKWNEGDDLETKLEKIITQKYISLFPYSYEAWSELRRTGYPKLFPVLNVEDGDRSLKQGDLLRRMPYPGDTDAIKQDINDTGLKALGGSDVQATRLWWDIDKPNF